MVAELEVGENVSSGGLVQAIGTRGGLLKLPGLEVDWRRGSGQEGKDFLFRVLSEERLRLSKWV